MVQNHLEKIRVVTGNPNRRSFELDFEAGVLMFNRDFAANLRFLQQSSFDRSVFVDSLAWSERSTRTRLLENAAGLLSPLL